MLACHLDAMQVKHKKTSGYLRGVGPPSASRGLTAAHGDSILRGMENPTGTGNSGRVGQVSLRYRGGRALPPGIPPPTHTVARFIDIMPLLR